MKRCGLVLYNTEDRQGADSEAKTMTDCLVKAGFHTRIKEWKDSKDLFTEINRAAIEELVSNGLSLLVVSIMSHGAAITSVLHDLRVLLPKNMPLVSRDFECISCVML